MCSAITTYKIYSPLPSFDRCIHLGLIPSQMESVAQDRLSFCYPVSKESKIPTKLKDPTCHIVSIECPFSVHVRFCDMLLQILRIKASDELSIQLTHIEDIGLRKLLIGVFYERQFVYSLQLIAELYNYFQSAFPQLSSKRAAQLDKFLDRVSVSYKEQYTIGHYADMAHISKETLINRCQYYLNLTPRRIIEYYRLDEAKRMLESADDQVKLIAYKLGYEDVSYFIQMFKKHTGRTPLQYRKEMAKQEMDRIFR